MKPRVRPGSVFVGRHQELADLSAALEDALNGYGRIVMLAGEPGIGKTRTAEELASQATSLGAEVFWGWWLFDMHMINLVNGRERTTEEYARLLERAGWKYLQTWYPSHKMLGVVEGVKA